MPRAPVKRIKSYRKLLLVPRSIMKDKQHLIQWGLLEYHRALTLLDSASFTNAPVLAECKVEVGIQQHNKASEFIYFSLFTDNFTSLSKPQRVIRDQWAWAVQWFKERKKNLSEIETSWKDFHYTPSRLPSSWMSQCREICVSFDPRQRIMFHSTQEESVEGHKHLRNV